MNKTELIAFKWLLRQGINKEDITFRSHKTPDFTIKDGRKFEIKKTGKRIKQILIEEHQFPSLIKDPNTKILIFREGMKKPSFILPVTKLKKGIKRVDNISISWKKFNENEIAYTFKINKKLWKRFTRCLRKVYWEEGISIDKWLFNSIEEFIKENE